MYDTHLWSEYSKTGYERISLNDFFHNLPGMKPGDSISAAFVNTCMDNSNMLRRKSLYNFIVRLYKSTNVVITSILQSVYFIHGSRLFDDLKDTIKKQRNDCPG